MLDSYEVRNDGVPRSPVNASNSMFGVATETRKMLGETPSTTLVVGTHPTMDRPIGSRLLLSSEFPERLRTEVVGEGPHVMERLRSMSRTQQRKYGIVIAAFESHHIRPQDRPEFVELMESLSHGTVIITDYAVALQNPDEVLPMAARKIDRGQLQRLGGPQGWYDTHQTYTAGTFFETMEDADWSAEARFLLDDFSVGFVGSSTINSREMREIIAKALCVRNHSLAAICQRYSHHSYY